VLRGEIYTYPAPRGAKGHEQQGNRFCVIVGSDDLPLSTVVVCPTSTSARPTDFRPEIEIDGKTTYVLPEQITAVDRQRLGHRVGQLTRNRLADLNAALTFTLGLD
jgi:mRNA interferase MazF